MNHGKFPEHHLWMHHKQHRISLFMDYVHELDEIAKQETVDEEEIIRNCITCMTTDHFNWQDIQCEGEIVGFLITAVYPECHPDCDHFIVESYVQPQYRHKGLMSQTVRNFVKQNPGKYCMVILNLNEYAKGFWAHLFSEMNYAPMTLREVPNTFQANITQYGFQPNLTEKEKENE